MGECSDRDRDRTDACVDAGICFRVKRRRANTLLRTRLARPLGKPAGEGGLGGLRGR